MKIESVVLKSKNPKRLALFYSEILNFPQVSSSSKRVTISVGSSTLIIEKSRVNFPPQHLAFNIPGDSIFNCIDYYSHRIDFLRIKEDSIISHFENWKAQSVYFYDTDGNILEFIARMDLDTELIAPFDSNDILNISEVGIVNKSPLRVADELQVKTGISLYSKNVNENNFVVVGDEEGLLIFVTEGRNWFPTTTPASALPVQVSVVHDKKAFDLEF